MIPFSLRSPLALACVTLLITSSSLHAQRAEDDRPQKRSLRRSVDERREETRQGERRERMGEEGEEFEVSPAERMEWELGRLRDPATGAVPAQIRARELMFAATLPSRDGGSILARRASASGLEWTRRGPMNVGGRTRALRFDLTDTNVILAGGATGGMWRSTDGGASWRKTTAPTELQSVSCLAQDPRPGKTDVWYYGTGEMMGGYRDLYWGDGLFKSTDRGVTWQPLTATTTHTPRLDRTFDVVTSIAVDLSNMEEDEVYAAALGTIQRSTDGGATWKGVLGTLNTGGAFTDVAVTRTGVVYAALGGYNPNSAGGTTVRGIYRSEDGITWTNITPGFWPAPTLMRAVLAVSPSNENKVYILGENIYGFSSYLATYTWHSGDGSGAGGEWTDLSDNIPNFDGIGGGSFSGQGGYSLTLAVKPDDENTVFLGGVSLFRSTNGFSDPSGTAWIGGIDPEFNGVFNTGMALAYPDHWVDQHAIVFQPGNPSVVLSGNDGGVRKTSNCMAEKVRWQNMNHGYLTSELYTIALDHATAGDPTIVGGMQDNGTWLTASADPATSWGIQHPLGDGSYCAIADGGSSLYTSVQYGIAIRLIPDASKNYTRFAYITPAGAEGDVTNFINPFVLDPVDSKIMYYAGGPSIWRNSDLTAIPLRSAANVNVGVEPGATINWEKLSNTWVGDGRMITALGVSTASPAHRLYFGTAQGRLYRVDDAAAGQPAAVDVSGGNFPRNANIGCVAVDPRDGAKAIVVFSNYGVISLFATTDAGETWTPVAGNLEQSASGSGNGPACLWASILPMGTSTTYFVGTTTGLYSTAALDGASTVWTHEGEETIGNAVVTMIDVRAIDRTVAVATFGAGVFTATAVPLGVEAPTGERLALLDPVTPNPVRGSALLRYHLPSASHATLRLFDELGREVSTLLDADLPAGDGSAELRTESLPTGIYYCRLEAGGVAQTRGVTVVR